MTDHNDLLIRKGRIYFRLGIFGILLTMLSIITPVALGVDISRSAWFLGIFAGGLTGLYGFVGWFVMHRTQGSER